jgi:ABC-type uncharacterized transport system ATPase subunit
MSGLDPVGCNVMRDVLLDSARQGRTLVLSSHQMETVERLCDAIALINRGRKLLDGPVSDVKRRHGTNTVALAYEGDGSFLAGCRGGARQPTSAATWRSGWRRATPRRSCARRPPACA